jgi:drug/metabolite transporter (DMT)-like permease
MQIVRFVMGIMVFGLSVWLVPQVSLAMVSIVGKLYGIFVAILTTLFLKHILKMSQIIAILISFIGVCVMSLPGDIGLLLPVLGLVLATFLAASSDILVKKLTAYDSSLTILTYYLTFGTVCLGVLQPFFWQMPASPMEWVSLLGVGLVGTAFQFFLTQAYRYLQAPNVAIWSYTELLWSILLSIVVWQDIPTVTVFLGAGLILGSVVFIQNVDNIHALWYKRWRQLSSEEDPE